MESARHFVARQCGRSATGIEEIGLETRKFMPLEPNQPDDDFEVRCEFIVESLESALKYASQLKETKRNKKQAKTLLTKMRYHATHLLSHIGEFEKYL